MRQAIQSLAPAFAILLVPSVAAATPIVMNGSFEAVQIGPPFLSTNVADVPFWTRTGAPGDAALWHVGYADGGGSITTAGEGLQFTTLGGGASGVVATTHWSQTVPGFVPGDWYLLSFMAANEHGTVIPAFAIPQTLDVSFLSGSATPGQSYTVLPPVGPNYWRVWETHTLLFQADAISVTLDFASTTAYDLGIDDIFITQVPEPSALTLLGTIAALAAAIQRMRKTLSRAQ